MKIFKYFFQFLIVISLFATFKVIGQRNASFASSYLAKIFGPWFRSKKIIEKNLKICFKEISSEKLSEFKFTFSAIKLVPALPGKQKIFDTFFDLLSIKQIACSLPPLPIIPTFIYNDLIT